MGHSLAQIPQPLQYDRSISGVWSESILMAPSGQ